MVLLAIRVSLLIDLTEREVRHNGSGWASASMTIQTTAAWYCLAFINSSNPWRGTGAHRPVKGALILCSLTGHLLQQVGCLGRF